MKRVVVYDGDCGLCRRSIRWFQRLDWLRRLEFRPFQDLSLFQEFSELDKASCEKEMKFICAPEPKDEGSARIFGGAEAFFRMGLNLPILFPICLFFLSPIFRRPTRWIYQKVAANRHRFGSKCSLKR